MVPVWFVKRQADRMTDTDLSPPGGLPWRSKGGTLAPVKTDRERLARIFRIADFKNLHRGRKVFKLKTIRAGKTAAGNCRKQIALHELVRMPCTSERIEKRIGHIVSDECVLAQVDLNLEHLEERHED
ncbi:MAG TPA: hypothetical protein VI874_05055, partial [Candidatus Norongarragalinales archaeon]|nr:hypothetical protein [Candidatus Norongarragalinales archaeon]